MSFLGLKKKKYGNVPETSEFTRSASVGLVDEESVRASRSASQSASQSSTPRAVPTSPPQYVRTKSVSRLERNTSIRTSSTWRGAEPDPSEGMVRSVTPGHIGGASPTTYWRVIHAQWLQALHQQRKIDADVIAVGYKNVTGRELAAGPPSP